MIRFHGVLAPNAKLRALVVPQGPEVEEQVTDRRGRQRMRGRDGSGSTAPNRLGTAAQARLSCDIT